MWKHQAQKCQSVLVWNLQEWELSLWSYGNSRMSGCPDILKQPQIRYPFKSGFGLLTCTSLLLNPPVWRILLCWRVRYATFWMVKHIFFTIFTVNHSKSMVNLLLASEIPPFFLPCWHLHLPGQAGRVTWLGLNHGGCDPRRFPPGLTGVQLPVYFIRVMTDSGFLNTTK